MIKLLLQTPASSQYPSMQVEQSYGDYLPSAQTVQFNPLPGYSALFIHAQLH